LRRAWLASSRTGKVEKLVMCGGHGGHRTGIGRLFDNCSNLRERSRIALESVAQPHDKTRFLKPHIGRQLTTGKQRRVCGSVMRRKALRRAV